MFDISDKKKHMPLAMGKRKIEAIKQNKRILSAHSY